MDPDPANSDAPGHKDPTVRSAKEEGDVLASITELFEKKITFNGHLGMKIINMSSSPVKIGFDMKPELVGHFLYGRLHGGVISSVLDATGGLAVMQRLAQYHSGESAIEITERFRYLGTVDLRVDFLRQGIGDAFVAEGCVVRLGKRIASTSMQLHNESGTLLATGNATYVVS